MKITKIRIRNLFGIREMELDGSDIEVTGANGVGKTSILDAIRYALTNDSDRQYIIRNGENEGEIYIETDTGVTIDRRKRTTQADYKSVKDGRNVVTAPESFLRTLFSDLQINPVEFIRLPVKEQNRAILDLIDFSWDLNWIREKFGEIPEGVDYAQNILQVLFDIQSENGPYFMRRQDINRDIRNKNAIIAEIAASIPHGYDADKWRSYDMRALYEQLTSATQKNNLIERARAFRDSYDNKIRGYQAEREIAATALRAQVQEERERLTDAIAAARQEIRANEEKIAALDGQLKDKLALEDATYEQKVLQLQKDMGTAAAYTDQTPIDTKPLQDEINTADAMRAHLNEYDRMRRMQTEVEELSDASAALTEKIELARTLPGQILQSATIPVEGLTVEDGVPMINGLPVSNLSEGEKLQLCVDVALSKPNGLQIILMDGVEKLSEANREKLYARCKEKGVQFIATRTTDADELQVTTL